MPKKNPAWNEFCAKSVKKWKSNYLLQTHNKSSTVHLLLIGMVDMMVAKGKSVKGAILLLGLFFFFFPVWMKYDYRART